MGLAEKRAATAYQQKQFPAIKAEIDQITGRDVPIDVDWSSLCWENQHEKYENIWTYGMFAPLVEALKAICVDDLGKAALNEKLQRISVKATGTTDYLKCELRNGELSLGYNHYDKVGERGTADFSKRTNECVKSLEAAL